MVTIRLLGVPEITGLDGAIRPVRGYQALGVLARVLLADRPIPRRQLAAELFPDTVDPLGALRWCLAALRRAIGADAMVGDPLIANLPDGSRVDALSIDDPDFDPLSAGELLQDSAPEASGTEFATWLLVERARIAARIDERLRRDTLAALVVGDSERALVLARVAVLRQPFDEGRQILLVRALVLSGQPDSARAHADQVDADFLRELGEPASPALRSAARAGLADPPPGPGPATVVETLLEAGTAALAVGAMDAGIDCLRRAAALAEAMNDTGLTARSLVELGTALIHSVRGQDDEGILHLRSAEEMALRIQNRTVACKAVLELSYADALAGRRPDAQRLAVRALELADGDPAHQATAHAFAGFNLADWGRHDDALVSYDLSLAAARSGGAGRREAWALGLGSWCQMRAGRLDDAETWAREALDKCETQRWLSFRPWPEAVLAEVQVRGGVSPAAVLGRLEPTLALSCQLSDPCWEAATCRVIGLAHEVDGQPNQALSWLGRASRVASGFTDFYAALQSRILFDQARITLGVDTDLAAPMIRNLLAFAARAHADVELDAAVSLHLAAGQRGRKFVALDFI